MKNTWYFLLAFALIFACSTSTQTHTEIVKDFQYKLNTQYADKEDSPLTEEGLKTFNSLEFYKIDEKTTGPFSLKLMQVLYYENDKIKKIDHLYDTFYLLALMGKATLNSGNKEKVNNYLNDLARMGILSHEQLAKIES